MSVASCLWHDFHADCERLHVGRDFADMLLLCLSDIVLYDTYKIGGPRARNHVI